MWDFLGFLFDFVAPIAEFLVRLYALDDRAEARAITVGCGVVVVLVVVVIGILAAVRGI